MRLRSLNPTAADEYHRLVELWRAAGLPFKPRGRDSREAIAAQVTGGTHTFLGLETDDGQLIGAVLATHDGRKGWINRLAVHPDYRRQGFGQRLIEAADQALHAQGIGIIAALIEPENEASLALFLKAGYADWPGIHYVSKRQSKDS